MPGELPKWLETNEADAVRQFLLLAPTRSSLASALRKLLARDKEAREVLGIFERNISRVCPVCNSVLDETLGSTHSPTCRLAALIEDSPHAK